MIKLLTVGTLAAAIASVICKLKEVDQPIPTTGDEFFSPYYPGVVPYDTAPAYDHYYEHWDTYTSSGTNPTVTEADPEDLLIESLKGLKEKMSSQSYEELYSCVANIIGDTMDIVHD